MKLVKIRFNYNVQYDEFNALGYYFIQSASETKEGIIQAVLTDFKAIENVVDMYLKGKTITKKRKGKISDEDIEFGYEYSSKKLRDAFASNSFRLNLKYAIEMDGPDKIEDTNITIDCYDKYPKMLEIYEALIQIDGLDFSKSADTTMKMIGAIRSGTLQYKLLLDVV